jgi:glycosyltransferase involved in cell wall biosynthesis
MSTDVKSLLLNQHLRVPGEPHSPERKAVCDATSGGSRGTRRRVLSIINGEHYAGNERAQDLMALRLPEFGYEVQFVCLKAGKFADSRRSQSTPLVTVPMRSRFDLRPVRAVARIIREGEFSLVHTHTPRSALVGGLAARLARVPLVHHIQSPTSRDSVLAGRNWMNALVERWSLRHVAGVIPVSQTMCEYAHDQGMTGRHLAVVPNGVPARDKLADRPSPQDVWTIGMVALFRPRKGLDILIESLARLRAAGRPVRLRAVGGFETPQYESQILALVDKLGVRDAIEWRGFRSDIMGELSAMDLFVLPSLFGEGLPFVILEAMSAGVPVVSTKVEGIPEAVRDGQDGIIAAPGDADDLARGICRVLDGEVDWQSLRRSAFERQRRYYTDETMAQGVANVYEAVLASASGHGAH